MSVLLFFISLNLYWPHRASRRHVSLGKVLSSFFQKEDDNDSTGKVVGSGPLGFLS